jgi:hypothetical protein
MRTHVRLYKVRVLEVGDLTPHEPEPPSNTYCVVFSVMNYRNPHPGREILYVDADKQIHRFETPTFHHGNIRVNCQFVVPGTNNQVRRRFDGDRSDHDDDDQPQQRHLRRHHRRFHDCFEHHGYCCVCGTMSQCACPRPPTHPQMLFGVTVVRKNVIFYAAPC